MDWDLFNMDIGFLHADCIVASFHADSGCINAVKCLNSMAGP